MLLALRIFEIVPGEIFVGMPCTFAFKRHKISRTLKVITIIILFLKLCTI
jgi:hypothetical protein